MSYTKNSLSLLSKKLFTTLLVVVMSFFFASSLFAGGEDLFKGNCSACHKLDNKKLVGPGLGGVTENRTEEWFVNWVKNSQALIDSGDEQAVAIHNENGGVMPAFGQLSDDEIKSIYKFLGEQPKVGSANNGNNQSTATNTVSNSNDTFGQTEQNPMVFFGVLFVLIIGGVILYKVNEIRNLTYGTSVDPYHIKNYPLTFLGMLIVAVAIAYLLIYGLESGVGHIYGVLFAVFPYVALAVFLVGSIYRWRKKGFKVSSLSSQFLEGEKLFWGSQLFHWGLVVLFFGHLIAFLFPSSVLAWNGSPVRLLILEITSFIFGLSAFVGLLLLIKRRLTTKTVLMVTNKMDMLVYVVLLTQIISGLLVAIFARWGAGWFAAALTPYLQSVFSFNPDVSVIEAAPIYIQIHVISAFFIIAIIPFTRFVHFLVAPIDYLWRSYQQVVWNWNRKQIRNSRRHFFGKRPRNH
jgi:nitrate reductase gamma subunit